MRLFYTVILAMFVSGIFANDDITDIQNNWYKHLQELNNTEKIAQAVKKLINKCTYQDTENFKKVHNHSKINRGINFVTLNLIIPLLNSGLSYLGIQDDSPTYVNRRMSLELFEQLSQKEESYESNQ